MARPVVHASTEKLYESLGTGLTKDDEETGWQLLKFLDTFMAIHGIVDVLVRDSDAGPGWSRALDPDRALNGELPWLAQFVGVRFPLGLTNEDERRTRLKNKENWERGGLDTMREAIQVHLTGSQLVEIYERDTSAWHFRVVTYAIETPDEDRVLAEIIEQKEGGLQFVYQVQQGGNYDQLSASFATYDALDAAFVDYADQTDWVPV